MIKASVNQFDMDSGWQGFLNNLRRGKGHQMSFWWNRLQWNHFYKFNIVPRFPLNIDIEASSKCNLKCEHCFRQYMDIQENHNMPMDMYKKIVDECAQYGLFTLKFSMRGEATLNPHIVEMVDYAKKKGIKEVWINSNAGMFTEEMAEGLIKAGLDCLTVSVDGLGEVYESIRPPAKFEDTIRKMKLFRDVRDRLGSTKPIFKAQSLWSAIKDDPDEYLEAMSEIVDKVSYNIDFNYKDFTMIPDPDYVCYRLWQRIAITSTGDILKCPSDFTKDHVLGNIMDHSIKELWDTDQQKQRELHLKGKRLDDKVCVKCHHGATPVDDVEHEFSGKKHDVVGVAYKEEFKGHGVRNK